MGVADGVDGGAEVGGEGGARAGADPVDSVDPAYLAPGHYVDSDHPAIVRWARDCVEGATSDRERAVRLYYHVRDDIRYDPYTAATSRDDYRASTVLERERNWCVPKAVLLCAGARAVGVPCRLGYADVRNHLASEKLLASMGTDVFAYHGYVELHLDGRWVKATPAFNIEMCTRFGVQPLEFDGTEDSLYHPFDVEGRRHMEYIRQRGVFADLPFEEIDAAFAEIYPDGMGLLSTPDTTAVHDTAFHGDPGPQPQPA